MNFKIGILLFIIVNFMQFGFCSSHAEVLSGHVEKKIKGENQTNSQVDQTSTKRNSISPNQSNLTPASPASLASPTGPARRSNYRRRPEVNRASVPSKYPDLGIPRNSFPASFLGRWSCITKVINSACKDVLTGTEMNSEVRFLKNEKGCVVADWVQPGWTESQAYTVAWSLKEARVDRTCYYFADGVDGAWASRSRDHFLLKNNKEMVCKSYIDQYFDGRYLGRYRTVSILKRIK